METLKGLFVVYCHLWTLGLILLGLYQLLGPAFHNGHWLAGLAICAPLAVTPAYWLSRRG
jgi:hypothetical protein